MIDPTGMASDTTTYQGGTLQMVVVMGRSSLNELGMLLGRVSIVTVIAKTGWDAGDLISKNIVPISHAVAAGLVKLGVDPNKLYAPELMPKDSGTTGNGGTNTLKYTPPPKELKGFPDAKRVPNKGRARWKTKEGKILE